MSQRKQNGFSLIELLIVVAIILIIAAIAIPSLLRSRISANEASAVGSVRAINAAEITYVTSYPTYGYAGGLTYLGQGTGSTCTPNQDTACLLDNTLACPGAANGASCAKDGYSFTVSGPFVAPESSYQVNADPISASTGTRHFYSDVTGVIRYNTTTAATSADAALQ